jgi:hypothetical protein
VGRLDRPHRWLTALGLLALLQGPAVAHHSLAGEFDTHKTLVLTGVVSQVQWVNPHVYVDINVTDASGQVADWHLECVPVAMARKAGVSMKMLMGDGRPVTVDVYPERNGTPRLGFLARITYSDGHHVQFIEDGHADEAR